MTKIHAQALGPNVLLLQSDLEKLVSLARRSEAVEVRVDTEDVSTRSLMKLVEEGGAFDFWHEPDEDVYSLDDGEPV